MKRLMVKYTGEYKDLIPRGWEFMRLYARNYRTYHKGFGSNDSLWIFQKGNDLEILDLYAKSGWALNILVKNRDKIKDWIEHNSFAFRMNMKNGKARVYDRVEGIKRARIEDRIHKRKPEVIRQYYNKWRVIYLKTEMIDEILKLYDDGLIILKEYELDE